MVFRAVGITQKAMGYILWEQKGSKGLLWWWLGNSKRSFLKHSPEVLDCLRLMSWVQGSSLVIGPVADRRVPLTFVASLPLKPEL